MIVRTVAVGNKEEAFIEKEFKNTVNIISSDDNNKGKTIAIQSLMYCLGNVPVFPSTFQYQDYTYIVEFTHDDKAYILSRNNTTFILKSEQSLMVFDGVSEMKRYWSKNISKLPIIIKNDVSRLVDPDLLHQMFFIGQDKKDTSNIASKGFYNKTDFTNMLFSYCGLGDQGMNQDEVQVARNKIRDLKDEKSALQKKHTLLKSKKTSASYVSQSNDKVALSNKLKAVDKIKTKISSLRVSRNAAINRQTKYDITLKELNSLNRTINSGELRCLDCNSTHIGFASESNSTYTFDISTPDIRREIIESIKENIAAYNEDIEKYTLEINSNQEKLQALLSDDEISLESIVAYKGDVLDLSQVEQRVASIDGEITRLMDAIKASEKTTEEQIIKQQQLVDDIVAQMNLAYKQIDPNGNLTFDSLFTKRDQVFSGSEATAFHLVKLFSIAKTTDHDYPIIVDSFRAEDLSTDKEARVIELFNSLGKQAIFTTTLKNEELGKYEHFSNINHIDYSGHEASKMLQSNYVSDFFTLAKQLSISVET